jgi:two-component system LytT family response regulator
MAHERIRVIVAEDELLARELVVTYLKAHQDVDVVGQCQTGDELFERLVEAPADLIVLDINMPGRDVFEVLAAAGLGADSVPYVVFTTAYDKYAIRAFEVNALDFLLKPFTATRFAGALERVRGRFRAHSQAQPISQLIDDLGRRPKRLLVPAGAGLVPIAVADIDWIKAERDYSRLYVKGKTYLLSRSLTDLETRLDSEQFARIHRSAIVNVSRITEVKPQGSQRFRVILQDGTVLVLSRTRAQLLRDWKI